MPMPSDDELASLKSALQRSRRQPMQFAVGLGKAPGDHRLSLHATRAGKMLAREIRDTHGLKSLAWGVTEVDDNRADALVLALEDKPPTGLVRKLQAWLKLNGLPLRKVALKLGGMELADDDGEGEGDASATATKPARFPDLEQALKGLALKAKDLIERDTTLDALLLPALKAAQRALLQGQRPAVDDALKQLAARLQEAQARLARAESEFKSLVDTLEPALGKAVNKVWQLQRDPQVRQDRQTLAKSSTTIAQAIRQARLAAREGNADQAKALTELIAKERAAARRVLAPYWPGGKANPEGDWSLIVARLDLSSPKDGAVFWSGDKDNSIDLAIERGGISLESTGGGAMIDDWNETRLPWSGDRGEPPPYMMDLWQLASATYAMQAEGVITAIQTPEKQLTDGGEMWRRVERKILLKKELQGRATLSPPVIRPSKPKKADPA